MNESKQPNAIWKKKIKINKIQRRKKEEEAEEEENSIFKYQVLAENMLK